MRPAPAVLDAPAPEPQSLLELVARRAAPGRIQLCRAFAEQWHLFLYHPAAEARDDVYLSKAGDSRSDVLNQALADEDWDLSDLQ